MKNDPNVYDSKEGIEKLLDEGLEGLNRLQDLRSEAGYGRGERMKEWCILGYWITDSCGNFGRITEGAPAAAFSSVPRVMPTSEIYEHYVKHTSSTMSSSIPPAHVHCSECEKGFDIDNAHLVTEQHRDLNESAARWEGVSIEEANKILRQLSSHEVRRITGLTNPAWVDLSRHPRAKENDKDWLVNETGWRECGSEKLYNGEPNPGLTQKSIVPAGSTASYVVWTWMHNECAQKKTRRNERAFFERVFEKAGFTNVLMSEIENGYWSSKTAPPWFEVMPSKVDAIVGFNSSQGSIKIGWRKHVINIDWSNWREKRVDGEVLFADIGNITHGTNFVHAYGEEKCVEYLTRLREAPSAPL